MSDARGTQDTSGHVNKTRAIAAAIVAVVVFDAAIVQAPFLAFLGVPFLVAALFYRGRHVVTSAVLVLFCLLYVVIGVNYAIANGLQNPAEPGEPRETINIGDFVGVYGGTALAIWLGVRVVMSLAGRRRVSEGAAGVVSA